MNFESLGRGAKRQGAAVFWSLVCGIVVTLPTEVRARLPDADVRAMPGPWPARPNTAALEPTSSNAECERCHVEEAKDWRASLHARAYTNGAFQRALAIEPLAFCRGCHAPESNPLRQGDSARQALGVSCVSCHIVTGDVLAAPGNAPKKTHAVMRNAAFATAAACANCHEFSFPGQTAASGEALMQSTVTEHQSSEFAQVACASCHMPRNSEGRRSHRFDVTRNEALLKEALKVEVRRQLSGNVEFVLTSRGVGHAFPTGDLFRRLRIHVEAVGPEFSTVAFADAYLTRTFITVRSPGGLVRRIPQSDTRLGTGSARTRRIEVELSRGSAKYPLVYSITYERVEHPGKVGQPDAALEGAVELASGELPPGPSLPTRKIGVVP